MNDWAADSARPLRPRHGSIVRQAIFFTACFLVSGALVLLAVANIAMGETGYFVMFTLFGIIAFLTGYQAMHYLRDLGAAPVALEGEVVRKWHKGNLFIFFLPSFYLYVAERRGLDKIDDPGKPWSKIFAVSREAYALLLDTDYVRVTCYPHSLTVEQVERYDETDKRFVPAVDGATD